MYAVRCDVCLKESWGYAGLPRGWIELYARTGGGGGDDERLSTPVRHACSARCAAQLLSPAHPLDHLPYDTVLADLGL